MFSPLFVMFFAVSLIPPSLPLFPFIRGEVLPATFSLPHLLFFSTLLCLLSPSSIIPPLLSSSHLSLHCPPISSLASIVSSCPAHVTLPLSSVVCHPPSFLRVQPTVIFSSLVSLSSSSALTSLPLKRGCIEFKYYADGIDSGLTPPGNNS